MNENTKQQEQKGNGVLPCVSGLVLSFADWIKINKIPVLGYCKRNIKTYYLYNESIYNTDELFDEYRSCTDRKRASAKLRCRIKCSKLSKYDKHEK